MRFMHLTTALEAARGNGDASKSRTRSSRNVLSMQTRPALCCEEWRRGSCALVRARECRSHLMHRRVSVPSLPSDWYTDPLKLLSIFAEAIEMLRSLLSFRNVLPAVAITCMHAYMRSNLRESVRTSERMNWSGLVPDGTTFSGVGRELIDQVNSVQACAHLAGYIRDLGRHAMLTRATVRVRLSQPGADVEA